VHSQQINIIIDKQASDTWLTTVWLSKKHAPQKVQLREFILLGDNKKGEADASDYGSETVGEEEEAGGHGEGW